MPRLMALLLALAWQLPLPASRAQNPAHVPWLQEVEWQSSTGPATDELTNLDDLDSWTMQRQQWLEAWRDFLGPAPKGAEAFDTQVISEDSVDGVVRRRIRYRNEVDDWMDAYLLIPQARSDSGDKGPAVVALHPTTNETINEMVGISGRDGRENGLQLARHGYVVLCPTNFLWQQPGGFDAAVQRHRDRHPRSLGMAKMLFDAQRAVDFLIADPHVDRQKIGAFGHSLGAKEAWFLTAMDSRIQAAVASEGGIAWASTNWDAPWYLGPEIRNPDCPRKPHQLLALAAPRPLLVLGGQSGPGAADGTQSLPWIEAAAPAWQLHGQPIGFGLWNHRRGHTLDAQMMERVIAWFDCYLR